MRRAETRAFGQAIAGTVFGGLTIAVVSNVQRGSAQRAYDRALRDAAPESVLDDRRDRLDAINQRYQVTKVLTAVAWLGQIALAARTWAPSDDGRDDERVASARRIRLDVMPDEWTGGVSLRVGYVAPFAALPRVPQSRR
jgi:hypothetical protein